MQKFGEQLKEARKRKKISIDKASQDLVIKKNHLTALEEEDWKELPEPTFVKGYIKSYAEYLGIDQDYTLALYRREFDESKFPQEKISREKRRFFVTPSRIINTIFALAVVAFIAYLSLQYLSILSSPKLELASPKEDFTTSAPAIQIEGKTEKDATVSVNGKFIPVTESGSFSYEYVLSNGKNQIEIISAFRLSPKSKVTRTIRLIR